MPNDINATSATATPPSFSLGIAPNYLGVVSLVNSAGEVVRRWRLQHTKCTIGSDRQATIWIDDSKIASFHALLVFGSTNAIIKSFGPGLRLNGQSVQESAIRVGDRLELLGYQFLIESLSTSPLNSRNNAKVPDASSALDSAQLSRPQPAISGQVPRGGQQLAQALGVVSHVENDPPVLHGPAVETPGGQLAVRSERT